jgi:hypothetical protein
MHVTPTGVTNAANLSLFMVNVAYCLRADSHSRDADYSVLDLKADCRGYKYVGSCTVTVDRRIAPPTAASERSMIVSCHAAPQCSDTCHAYLPGGIQLDPGFSRRGSVHVRLGDWHGGNLGAFR